MAHAWPPAPLPLHCRFQLPQVACVEIRDTGFQLLVQQLRGCAAELVRNPGKEAGCLPPC